MKRHLWIFSVVIAFTMMLCDSEHVLAIGNDLRGDNIIAPEGRLFCPDHQATRGTVAMALYNMSSDGNNQFAPIGYSDVLADSPYFAAVSFCAARAYIHGYHDGTFKPEGYISRAEVCTILVNYLNIDISSSKSVFPPDVSPNHWAAEIISAVIDSHLMSGYEDGSFRPDNSITRAELATIIVNASHLSPPDYIREFEDLPKTHWAYKNIACVSAPSLSGPLALEVEVIELANAERVKAGADAIQSDARLCEMARVKAQDMIDNNYIDHVSPVWGAPDQMLKAFDIQFHYAGENITVGPKTPVKAVEAWIQSPSHNEVMLSKNYSKIGVGYAESSDGRCFWVQEFTD